MLARFWDFVVSRYQAKRLAEELASMDDRTLADFGITRGDIPVLARDEAVRLEQEYGKLRADHDRAAAVFGAAKRA